MLNNIKCLPQSNRVKKKNWTAQKEDNHISPHLHWCHKKQPPGQPRKKREGGCWGGRKSPGDTFRGSVMRLLKTSKHPRFVQEERRVILHSNILLYTSYIYIYIYIYIYERRFSMCRTQPAVPLICAGSRRKETDSRDRKGGQALEVSAADKRVFPPAQKPGSSPSAFAMILIITRGE